jgi:hypothetical protein
VDGSSPIGTSLEGPGSAFAAAGPPLGDRQRQPLAVLVDERLLEPAVPA